VKDGRTDRRTDGIAVANTALAMLCNASIARAIITSTKKDMFLSLFVCLSVCLSVSNFAQKLPNGFA